jgi:hypothetical protein
MSHYCSAWMSYYCWVRPVSVSARLMEDSFQFDLLLAFQLELLAFQLELLALQLASKLALQLTYWMDTKLLALLLACRLTCPAEKESEMEGLLKEQMTVLQCSV